MKNNGLSLQELWRLGCRGEPLAADDRKRFAARAHSRFHTFQMGMDHAADDTEKTAGLMHGLVVELNDSPGLRELWLAAAISQTHYGETVTMRLATTVIH